MPKRRRLYTHIKNKAKLNISREDNDGKDKATTARGRLKGALMEVLDPTLEESGASSEESPSKRDRDEDPSYQSEDEVKKPHRVARRSPPRQSYVLKLFDRSVDLSQFSEGSPLYPICRAWIANQPKANYRDFGKKYEDQEPSEDMVELPGPEGPPVTRIPELLPEQLAANKDNINLNYREAPPPSREQLLQSHSRRWAGVRRAWLHQALKVEERYENTQQLLNNINVNAL